MLASLYKRVRLLSLVPGERAPCAPVPVNGNRPKRSGAPRMQATQALEA